MCSALTAAMCYSVPWVIRSYSVITFKVFGSIYISKQAYYASFVNEPSLLKTKGFLLTSFDILINSIDYEK